VLVGTGGADTINGLGGNDTITGGAGNDAINGGDGVDTAVFSGLIAASTVSTTGGTTTVVGPDGTDTLTGVEFLRFDNGTLIVGAGGGQLFQGTGGNDVLNGTAFADDMSGGAGDDVINGGAGDDTLRGGAGNDALTGGAGIDTVDYSSAAAGVLAQLNSGAASNDGDGGSDTLTEIENLTGSAFNDVLVGFTGANVLRGGLGSDVLIGLDGDDVIFGGSGVANELYGGAGNDRYVVEADGDTIVEQTGEGVDLVETALARLILAGNVENLTYTGVSGFEGQGNAGANILRGGAQRDALLGFGGDDTIFGGAGVANELYGGAGNDYYVIEANDTIVEQVGDGTDTVESRLNSFTLGTNVENLIFGGTGNFTGAGNALNNSIRGGAGDDTLTGGGGTDEIQGGLGTDIIALQGIAGDYTITAEGAGWRIVDGTAGRDGSILAVDVEILRFGNGATQTLGGAAAPLLSAMEKDAAPLVLPSSAGDMGAFGGDGLLVLPPAMDDAFLPLSGLEVPEVLPAIADDFILAAKYEGPPVMPTPEAEFDAGLVMEIEFAQGFLFSGGWNSSNPDVSADGLTVYEYWSAVAVPTRQDFWG
jgi:Ca2+-binding RTX toxin-like protein